jgi:glyoxylase-like metal-dependent hydrolase (beta-lactamase superfamily II)
MSSDSDGTTSSSWLTTSERDGDGVEESGSVHIPSGGISVSDAMEAALLDRFVSSVVPVETLEKGSAAQIVSESTTSAALEPARYLVALSPPSSSSQQQQPLDYCLVDVPPFTNQLVDEMNAFMGKSKGRLRLVVVTSRDAIHYDSASSTDYETMVRKSDLHKWKAAFPDVCVVSYRLDTPRDCREVVTQVLDGYGPFALEDKVDDDDKPKGSADNARMKFVETGRPLMVEEWDFNVAQDVMSGKAQPPDDGDNPTSGSAKDKVDDSPYSPEKVREREEGKRLIAVYTPGHTYGSVSYVFPEIGVCCSGYAIPVEDSRLNQYDGGDDDEGDGFGSNVGTGPILDCRGYITTSRAGIQRQMESARKLIQTYGDRFDVILPSRGDPLLWLPTSVAERKKVLLDIVKQYEKIGTIYEDLGITASSS